MSHPDFEQLAARLFSTMRLPHDRAASAHAAYTIRIDGNLLIDLIGVQQGAVNLRSVFNTLPANIDNGALLHLLYANQFTFEHPPVSIGIDPGTAAVTVWSRQALRELGDDMQCRWFERFVMIASAVHRWLDTLSHQPSSGGSSSPVLTQARMRRAHGPSKAD